MLLIDELELQRLCKKYNIKYKLFKGTGVILLDSGLDEWQVKIVDYREKPYCLLHKNKCRRNSRFHIQRYLRTLFQVIDCIANHKKVLVNLYSSPNTYNKNKRKGVNF